MTNSATTVQTIIPTSVTEGTILELRSATGKAVTLKHATTTATSGEIFLRNRADTLLSEFHPTVLQNNSGAWYEIPREFGIINASFSRVTATNSTTVVIPADDTTPLATEGLRVINSSYTPKLSNSVLEITAKMLVAATAATGQLSAAMFVGTATAAAGTVSKTAAAVTMTNAGVGSLKRLDLTYPHTVTATNALNIEVNVGPTADTLYFGGMATTAIFGASRDAWLIIKERVL